MNTKHPKFAETIRHIREQFVTKQREDGSTYHAVEYDNKEREWLTDNIIYPAHMIIDTSPSDWIYEEILSALDIMHDAVFHGDSICASLDMAASEVGMYTYEVSNWYSQAGVAAWVDDLEDGRGYDFGEVYRMSDRIRIAMQIATSQIYGVVRDAVADYYREFVRNAA